MKHILQFFFTVSLVFTLQAAGGAVLSQEDEETASESGEEKWDTTQARGETRDIAFTTDEGTFMSVDVSPDGQWILFDLLAHIYRVPVNGGEAESLTQDSGVAVNYHPAWSPDGRSIAFISDRKGQDNLWIMDANGGNPRQVAHDLNARHVTPGWSADGNYIYVRKRGLPKPGSRPDAGLWMFHRDGGKGIELVGRDEDGASWPAASADGNWLYFHRRDFSNVTVGHRDALAGDMQIRRLNLETGEIFAVSAGTNRQQSRGSSGGAAAPEVSPDGKLLAFIRRIPDGTISYKGHKFGPRTALWLRDLEKGTERILMDPVEQDMIEGMKTLRILPGYSFTPDGKSIVISQGGKLRRVDIATGRLDTIPFTARVERTISEQAYQPFRISDDPFEAKFLRWYAASPDGSKLAFQAVGKIWMQDLPNGTPRRLTPDSFEPFEYAPAWSPDGRSIAFTTWDEAERGHVWKIRAAAGGRPQQLSTAAGEYIHPDWSTDGKTLVLARGGNATARGRNMQNNPWWDIVRLPADGGEMTAVSRIDYSADFGGARHQLPRPVWGPDNRIFFLTGTPAADGNAPPGSNPASQLVSVAASPSIDSRRIHARFEHADEVVISPDGSHLAFLEGDNIYLAPFPYRQASANPMLISKQKDKGKLPVTRLSKTGGLYPNWRDAATIEFGSAATYFSHNLNTDETTETAISLSVPRPVPAGRIAMTNARIVTMRGQEVLENATIVIDGSRIVCTGDCNTDGADRVIDAAGSTIIPGFVDMHAHHFREYNGIIPAHGYESAIYLAYGVTTGLDNSMWSQNVFSSAELVEAGKVIGPRTFSTGDPLYNRDSPRQNLLTSYEMAEQDIKRLKSWGAVSIKQYLQPRRDQRQWVSDAARKEGLMVTAEGSDLAYNLGMIMDGQTAFEHPMSYMPLYGDAATFFGQAKAVYSPTFIVGGPSAWNEEYFWQETEIWKDAKQRRWLPWRQLVPNTRRTIKRPATDYSFPLIAQGMADVIAAGGYGAIGSHGQQHGIGSHWEIWMAASATGAHGALDVATRQGAYFLGAIEDLGTLETGKIADLLVLNSNPLDDIHNTLDIGYVMKGGVLYEADTLDEVWPEEKAFGPNYWVDPEIYRSDDRPVDYHED